MSHRSVPAARRQGAPARGFSLVEIVIALTLAGILFGLAAPAYRAWISSQQLANQANDLAGMLNLARSEAIKRGSRVNLCKTGGGRQCSDQGGWERGWMLYADENDDGEVDAREPLLRIEPAAEHQITVSGNRPVADYVSYTSLGHARLRSGALQMGTFVVCKAGEKTIHVVLANSGRARVENTNNRCP